MDIPTALAKIVDGHNLSQEDTAKVFHQIMSGEATAGQIGAILAALRVKGETPEEIAGAAMTMRALANMVPVKADHLVDTCGTGGQRHKTVQHFHGGGVCNCGNRCQCGETRQSKNDQLQRQCRCIGSGRRRT